MPKEESALVNLGNLALQVRKEIEDVKKKHLAPLEDELKTYKSRMIILFRDEEEKTLSVEGLGKFKMGERKSPAKLDLVAIMKDLKVEDLEKYMIPGKVSENLTITLEKK